LLTKSEGNHVPTQRWAQKNDVHEQMADMIFGYWVSQMIRAAAEFSLAEHLADGPLTADEVARRTGSAPDTTFRLLRAAATLDLLTVDPQGRFHPTALLNTLRGDAPRSLRGMALAVTNRAHWLPWAEFVTSVRTGQSHGPAALGMPLFEYLQQNPALAQEFSAGMDSLTSLWAGEIVAAIDTSSVALAIDVGGANGTLLRMLQQANPALQGMVFDRPDVAAELAAAVASSEFADRTDVIRGDFFAAVPGGDLYLLKFILHDWDDDSCVRILQRSRESMAPGGRVAIIEMVLAEQDDPGVAALMDLNMLAVAGGRERSLAEYDALLAKAGLRRSAVQGSGSPQSVIEAVAA
jgi:hypothetical protein